MSGVGHANCKFATVCASGHACDLHYGRPAALHAQLTVHVSGVPLPPSTSFLCAVVVVWIRDEIYQAAGRERDRASERDRPAGREREPPEQGHPRAAGGSSSATGFLRNTTGQQVASERKHGIDRQTDT